MLETFYWFKFYLINGYYDSCIYRFWEQLFF